MRSLDYGFALPHRISALLLGLLLGCPIAAVTANEASPIAQVPLFMGGGIDAPPLTMLIMGRDHTLYYEAYNDASDLNDDGVLDVGYKPADIDYFGYFDSYLCYAYSAGDARFNPISETADKRCPGSWSGDFLNYITTVRIDALRKVLYGGRRVVDTQDLTVLERSYIPQDAHSWGKEYKSIEHDGYDIRDYAPLSLPAEGTRHLFANTTLLKSGAKEPLMRVLNDSVFRIWEWVAIEREVAGDDCNDGSRRSCTTGATILRGHHPNNSSEYQTLIETWGTDAQRCGSGEISGGVIDTSGSNNNPFTGGSFNGCTHDYYLTVIRGQLYAASDGDYEFATNGDDAVELLIDNEIVTGWYGGHGAAGDGDLQVRATNTGSVVTKTLTAGWHPFAFHHEEITGGDNYQLLWKPPSAIWAVVPAVDLRGPGGEADTAPEITTYSLEREVPASAMTDYVVRVQVCDTNYLTSNTNCRPYTDSDPATDDSYKPVGLLQRYGETDKMLFGLISGSYNDPKNMQGGVLRKNIESFQDEVDPQTGILTDTLGIARTIDRFRIVDFNMGTNYQYQGGWLTTKSMVDPSAPSFPDWGNPIGEMMYESLRYFSGLTDPTSDFMPTLTGGNERVTLRDYHGSSYLELPAPVWSDPYTRVENPALYCSPGAQLIISDVNPSYDTTFVPGSTFSGFSGDIAGLNAATEADAIWAQEHGGSSQHFIGQVGGDYDGAPSAKTVSGFGNIRGLAPSEPTKQGGYYSAGIARYAFENDLRDDLVDKQDINTFVVALASPLPKIDIPVGGGRVTLVPYAKSVGGYSINSTQGAFQPTDTIVDFFVETFANTDPAGSDADPSVNEGRPFVKFRINFEDVEQGADHDMDAIVAYEARVNADGTLTLTLTSEYAAGSIIQHMGYVISGTTADGVYLEVRDVDTAAGSDPAYFLDTPAGLLPGDCAIVSPPAVCNDPLPLFTTRTFTADSDASVATLLETPLWYAAKYGSEGNEDLGPGETSPNYFLVTNAGNLQRQLEEAFTRIILLTKSTSASAAASSTRAKGDTLIYQARFDSSDWSGELIALDLFSDEDPENNQVWDAADLMPAWDERQIFTWDPDVAAGVPFSWSDLNDSQRAFLSSDETLLNWLRGDDSAGSHRARTKILGDIVNSDPLYVGKPQNLGYGGLPEGTPGRDTYLDDDGFVRSYRRRTPMIYVGANDGMLHGFNAISGKEVFAYVPNAVFPHLADLANQDYLHRYFVDGSPSVGDAYVNGAWRSVLVGTLGAGGTAVFALDVTDPDDGDGFTAADVLWEFTDADLGQMVGQMTSSPVIGRLQNGDWAAVFGNGYDSGSGAWLYMVNLDDGSLIRKIQVSSDPENGLSAVGLIRDSQSTVAGAYAGDIKGNLWKFDLTGTVPADWDIAYGGALLQTFNDDGNAQPISGPLEVGVHPSGGHLVYFGTGQYMRATDPADQTVQSVYGVWDNALLTKDPVDSSKTIWQGGSAIGAGRGDLLEQDILYELSLAADPQGYIWRVFSKRNLDWGTLESPVKRGWFIDLVSPVHGVQGERVISRPQILSGSGLVLFTSLVPVESDDPCEFGGGESWVFAVDMFSGGRSEETTFDVNGDGVFNEEDTTTVNIDGEDVVVPLGGFKLDQIIDSPRVLLEGDDYTLVTAGSDGGDAEESGKVKGAYLGRQGWRQLR